MGQILNDPGPTEAGPVTKVLPCIGDSELAKNQNLTSSPPTCATTHFDRTDNVGAAGSH